MSNGTTKLRNKRFIKNLTNENRQVQFKPDNSEGQISHEASRHEGADTDRESESIESAGPLTSSRTRHSV